MNVEIENEVEQFHFMMPCTSVCFLYFIQHCLFCAPQISLDGRVEPKEVGSWVAKLVARLLATTAFLVQSRHLPKIQNKRHKQRSGQNPLTVAKHALEAKLEHSDGLTPQLHFFCIAFTKATYRIIIYSLLR